MVRKQCNRYREDPYGTDYRDVLQRGKRAHRLSGEFMVWGGSKNGVWLASTLPGWGRLPDDATVYRWTGKRWEERA